MGILISSLGYTLFLRCLHQDYEKVLGVSEKVVDARYFVLDIFSPRPFARSLTTVRDDRDRENDSKT